LKRLLEAEEVRVQALVDGLAGIALQYEQTPESVEVAGMCLKKLEQKLGVAAEQ